jgi:hypothetical protein
MGQAFRLANLAIGLKWWSIIVALSLVGIALVLAWDWFFSRRLPYVRWKAAQLPPNEVNIIRELIRVSRLKNGSLGQARVDAEIGEAPGHSEEL